MVLPPLHLPGRGFSRTLAAGVLAINLIVAGVAMLFLADERANDEEAARLQAENLVALFVQDIEHEYEKVDQSLYGIAEEYMAYLAREPSELESWLQRTRARTPTLNFLTIFDAGGEHIYGPDSAFQSKSNIADRAYFQSLRDDPQAGLQITPPLLGRTSGKMVIVLARRLNDLDGRFQGVVVASIPVDNFQAKFARLQLGPLDAIGLRDPQLRWIQRHPPLPETIVPGSSTLTERFRQALDKNPDAGVFHTGADSLDGVDRKYAYQRSGRYGFYVTVGLASESYLADSRGDAQAITMLLTAFALLSGCLGWLAHRALAHQAALTAELQARNEWISEAERIGDFGYFTVDLFVDHWEASESFCEIAGIGSEHSRTWAGWLSVVHPQDREGFEAAFRATRLANDGKRVHEYRIVRPADGAVRWLNSAWRLAADGDGRHQILGTIHDVTARRNAEDAQRQSELRFRSVFENSMIGMAITTPERGWIEANQAACDILGYPRAELLGTDWADITHPDDLARNLAELDRVVAGEIDAYELEKRYLRKDGSFIDADIGARVIRRSDGSIDYVITLIQDISARKRAEAALRESEQRLSAAFDEAAAGIAFVAPDGTWLRVNQRLCEILGYPESELLQLTFQDITHPDDLGADLAQVSRMLARKIDRYSVEKRYLRKDGCSVWANVTVSLLLHDDETPSHFVSIIEDIDARKRAERELRHSRELLQRFLDHLPGMAYIKDQTLHTLHANRRLSELLNLDSAEIMGRNNLALFPGEFGEKISADDRRVLVSGQTEVIEEAYGGVIYESTKFVIRQDDGPPLLGGLSVDITLRHQIEARTRALLEINELGGTLPEKAFLTHGIELAESLTGSTIGFLHFVNDDQETIELVTWTSGALKGCSAVVDSHYPLSQASIWADCCRQKRPVLCNDYAGSVGKRGLPDDHALLYRLVSVPVIEESAVRMILGVGNKAGDYSDFDLTTVQLIGNDLWRIVRRVRAEAALSRRLAEVTQLKEQVEIAHLQLVQAEKMSAVGQLAAGVAHELNNPIGFVYSNLGTLSQYIDDLQAIDTAYERAERLLPAADGAIFDGVRRLKRERDYDYLIEDLPKLIRESKEGLDRVREIILDLKDFSRVGESEWQWADLHQGLESTLNIVWNELKYKADVERQYGVLPKVYCMASQLNQVFMNLLINAVQAIEQHGRIVVRSAADADGKSVWVEIEDTGHGIPSEVQKCLFEPFFTTKPVGQGTGLGLSISFRIIEKHHGHIEVRSAVGRGSTFRITLPVDGNPLNSPGEERQPE